METKKMETFQENYEVVKDSEEIRITRVDGMPFILQDIINITSFYNIPKKHDVEIIMYSPERIMLTGEFTPSITAIYALIIDTFNNSIQLEGAL